MRQRVKEKNIRNDKIDSMPIKGCKRIVGSLLRYNSQHNFYECKTKCEIRYCSGFLLSIFDSFLRKKKCLLTEASIM